jgi:hypothetical protein
LSTFAINTVVELAVENGGLQYLNSIDGSHDFILKISKKFGKIFVVILRETELLIAELQKALDAANISIRDGGYYRGDVRVDEEARKIITDVISGDESL